MLIELLVGVSERLLLGLEKTLDEGASDEQTLQNLVAFHVDFALAEPDIIRIQDRELANLPAEANHRVRLLQRQYLEGWQQIVHRLRPDLSAVELEVRMHALFGVLNSTPHNARVEPRADVRAALTDAALVMLLETRSRPANELVGS
jgi:hypothetical protein